MPESAPRSRLRRWLRFRLRSAFLVIFVVSAAYGVWIRPVSHQQRIASAIRAQGGSVVYAYSGLYPRGAEPDVPSIVDLYVFGAAIESVTLSRPEVPGELLRQLGSLKSLRYLDLDGTRVTDSELTSLKGLTSLEVISLYGTDVTNTGLDYLRQHLPRMTIYASWRPAPPPQIPQGGG